MKSNELPAGSQIPQDVLKVIGTLEEAGFEAWLVGGCVRDLLMGLEPHDYDIASAAPPAQVRALFAHTAPTGERFGTETVLTGSRSVEVTIFREETGYSDFRRPDKVTFTGSIGEDLARRDFTVNAMAWHPVRGLLDPFGGGEDLIKKQLRAVGKPEERFREDPLRILRGFRFMAQHSLVLEPDTLLAAKQTAHLVEKISGERIRVELHKLLLSKPSVMIELINTGALDFLLIKKGEMGRLSALDELRGEAYPPVLGWAAFIALAKVDRRLFFDRLRFDNRTKERVDAVLAQLELPLHETKTNIKYQLRDFKGGPELYGDALRLKGLLFNSNVEPCLRLLENILEQHEPYCLSMLAVTGEDLIQAGIVKPGPELGTVLKTLVNHVIEKPEENRHETLMQFSKKLL